MSSTNYPLEKISWEKVEELCYKIASEIKKDDLEIDVLVPILRGGMPISLLLSSMLKVEETSCIHIRRSVDDNPNTEFREPINKGITNVDKINNSNILIIDDTLDSKKTLDYAIKLLKEYNPKSINIAVLYNFNKETFDEIYSGEKVENYKWVIFPWEDK